MLAKPFQRLSLRRKTALLFGLGLLGIVLGCLFITRAFFLYSLDQLESQEIAQDGYQASAIIHQVIETQAERAYDWAYWDETNRLFTEGDIEGYWQRNLFPGALDTLGLDLITFVTRQGEALASASRQTAQAQRDMNQQILSNTAIQQHLSRMRQAPDAERNSLAGLIRTGQQIWVITLTPVRNSEGTSAVSGWLIWGQHLSRRFPTDFQAILSTDNHIETAAALVHRFTTQDENTTKTRHHITRQQLLRDMAGQPIAVLVTQETRQYYQQGNTVFMYLIIAILCAASGVALATYFLFRNKIAARFTHFEQSIETLFSEWQLEKDTIRKKDELERITSLVHEVARSSSLAQDQLQDTLQKFEALYQHSSLGMMLVIDGHIQEVNVASLTMLSYTKDQLVGQTLESIWDAQPGNLQLQTLLRQLRQGQHQYEAVLLTGEQQPLPCGLEANLIQQRGQTALMLSITDMRAQKEQAKLIEDLAGQDAQSGLLNRPTIIALIEDTSLTTPQGFALLYFSIERLKQVASVYGHQAFDAAIQYLATLFSEQFHDAPVGRLSESEFIVLLATDTPLKQQCHQANKLMEHLRQPVEANGYQLNLSLKTALIEPTLTHYSLDYLLQAAYFTTHHTTGQNTSQICTIDEDAAEQARVALIISRDLNRAIRHKEIHPHYQPIVKAKTGEIIGFEALARWHHPLIGPVSPAVFIPLAEKHKLIIELGELILDQACQFCRELNTDAREKGQKPLTMHVNLSAPHFYHTALAAHLRTLINQYELAENQLVIEMTESMLIEAESGMSEQMHSIKAQGVQLALDDFGTGYSSFTTLCHFPLDIVKLDRSYINQLTHNDKASILVQNIARMANELGLTTVAEGVETRAQLEQLQTRQIHEIQGYYYYQPMPKAELLKLLRTNENSALLTCDQSPV